MLPQVKEDFIEIMFQHGPQEGDEPNGTTMVRVLEVVEERLIDFQKGKLACPQNDEAIRKIREGIFWLQERSRDRQARGVEGTYNP
jgi:hypothetical protein